MKNKQEKLVKTIKNFTTIFGMVYFALIVFLIFFDKKMKYFWPILISGSILIIGFTIFIVAYGVKLGKVYRKNIMSTKPKKRFKYLDSFYYTKIYATDDTSSTELIVYHVVQDIDSKKIYAIGEDDTNVRFQKIFDKTKLLRIDNMDVVSTRKDWKEVNYDDTGSFWIDQELVDYYQNDGERVKFKYFENECDNIKIEEIINRNQNYNISLLDKAIFITGYAEFDAK